MTKLGKEIECEVLDFLLCKLEKLLSSCDQNLDDWRDKWFSNTFKKILSSHITKPFICSLFE